MWYYAHTNKPDNEKFEKNNIKGDSSVQFSDCWRLSVWFDVHTITSLVLH